MLNATNIILSGGDPEFIGDGDPMTAMLGAGIELTALMGRTARRSGARTQLMISPRSSSTADVDGEMLAPEEVAHLLHLARRCRITTPRALPSADGMNLLAQHPEQRAVWQNDVEGVTGTAVEEIVRYASPVTFMRRTVTTDLTMSGHDFVEGDKVVMIYGAANRRPHVRSIVRRCSMCGERRMLTSDSAVQDPHFCLGANLARRELAVVFRDLFARLPDIEVVGAAVPLDVAGLPLVGGIKRLPVRFYADPHRSGV